MKTIFFNLVKKLAGTFFGGTTSSIKPWFYVFLVLGVGITILVFYISMKSAHEKATQLALENQIQQRLIEDQKLMVIEQNQRIILNENRMKELIERQKMAEEAKISIEKQISANKEKMHDLESKFNKNGRDIGKLADKKAKLVENVVNRGTEKTFRCFEIITGSPLTENENEIRQKNPDYNFCN